MCAIWHLKIIKTLNTHQANRCKTCHSIKSHVAKEEREKIFESNFATQVKKPFFKHDHDEQTFDERDLFFFHFEVKKGGGAVAEWYKVLQLGAYGSIIPKHYVRWQHIF